MAEKIFRYFDAKLSFAALCYFQEIWSEQLIWCLPTLPGVSIAQLQLWERSYLSDILTHAEEHAGVITLFFRRMTLCRWDPLDQQLRARRKFLVARRRPWLPRSLQCRSSRSGRRKQRRSQLKQSSWISEATCSRNTRTIIKTSPQPATRTCSSKSSKSPLFMYISI